MKTCSAITWWAFPWLIELAVRFETDFAFIFALQNTHINRIYRSAELQNIAVQRIREILSFHRKLKCKIIGQSGILYSRRWLFEHFLT